MSSIRSRNLRLILTCFGMIACISGNSTNKVSINNISPRFDATGSILDAHDGRIIQFGDTFYMYGTAYGNTDGYGTTNHFHCYKSSDLMSWQPCGDVLTNPSVGVYYRPHVIYNAKRKKYVLWYNWYKTLWSGQYGVAMSDQPEGPFSIVSQNVTVKNMAKGVGDFNLFVDEDAKGYLVYTTIADHTISVERLTDDYMGSLQTNSGVILPSAEACALFKRNGVYYVLADKMCQFCSEGSGAQVFTSTNPLGPFTYRGNINNAENTKYPASAAIDGDCKGSNWGNSGGWNDNTIGYFPDSLEVTFNSPKFISEVHVFTIQDGTPTTPTEIMTFSKGGNTAFDVEYWDGTSWKMIPGGSISSNNLVWRKLTFAAVSTTKIRLIVRGSKSGDFSRVIELEAYENGLNVAKNANGGSVRASSEYLDASDNIIHAQQTHIAEIPTLNGIAYVWMADRWGSRPDGIKGHDYQYWGEPLVFNSDGSILKMKYVNAYDLDLMVNTAVGEIKTKKSPIKVLLNASRQLVVQSALKLESMVTIYNVSGILLFSKNISFESNEPVFLHDINYKSGIYMVRIATAGSLYMEKICFI